MTDRIWRICALLFVGHVVTSCSFYSMHEGGAFKTENETIALPAARSNARSFYALDDSTLFFCPILKADDGWTISAFRTENGGNSWSHHADFSMDSFPFVYFDSVGDTVYLGLSSSSVDNPHCVVYSAERRGGAWRKIFSESKRLDGIHVWSGGAALVLSDIKSDPELWVSSDGGRIWDLKDTPFPLSISHYAFREGDLIAEVSNRLVRYELIPGICDTVYTPPLFSGKSEIIWNYMTTDDYVVLNEGYISKCMAFSGDSLEFRSRIRSREAPGAKIPTALYSRGDTVFVTLQNLAYELRRRTFASVDGGRHWRDLYEGSFASAQGGSLYSIIKNKDGQDCLYKTTVHPY